MNSEFDKLNIDKQVQFVNGELQKDKKISVTKLCKRFGINKSTIISRFTSKGYKYNADAREYIKDNGVIQKNNKSISETAVTIHQENSNSIESKELKTTLEEVKELLNMKEQLKEVIQHYNKSKNVIDVPEDPELKIDKDKFKGELKGRLIKVYDNVNDDWIKFCKKNSQFKMQDLYSQALIEFIEKYRNAK